MHPPVSKAAAASNGITGVILINDPIKTYNLQKCPVIKTVNMMHKAPEKKYQHVRTKSYKSESSASSAL